MARRINVRRSASGENDNRADSSLAFKKASIGLRTEVRLLDGLPGAGTSMATGEIQALEDAVAARYPEALAVIAHERMNAERRALRIRVRDLRHEYSGDVLRLRFELAAGSFATTVLREIIGSTDGE